MHSKSVDMAVRLIFEINENKCEVVVEDLGFGEFFKATGIIVKETFVIDEIKGE